MGQRAFSPGSVTTVFAPSDDHDGSLGVSFAVADGVTATVESTDEHGSSGTQVRLDGVRTAFDPVERALDDLGVAAAVDLEATIPVGCGFGASGAATLATTLAANERFDRGLAREDCVAVAHRAEVAAGTGLGDVFVQHRGGILWNAGDGVERRAASTPLEYETFGGIATADVLGDEATLARIDERGRDALADLDPPGSVAALFDRSWTFARETGLPTADVRDAVDRCEAAGGRATMAMVGETVVATGTDGTLAGETSVTADGATLRPPTDR
ncbi:GHMP kinase [Halomarina salina]|uniref:Pantoate kinase n=1 Tax=Halomarina salina TaxID=1872699 RepID=A0ABD5RK18_9EURY|nr:GHMP kinase [Halomarina salina]